MAPEQPTLTGIRNASVVTATEVIDGGAILIENGLITAIVREDERGLPDQGMLDAASCYLLPGLIDVHSDNIERQFEPRSRVAFPETLAFSEVDRYFAACGITTGFHAISVQDDDDRDLTTAQTLIGLVARLQRQGRVRHELHLRCELPQTESVAAVIELLDVVAAPIVSLMDHTPGQGKYRHPAWMERSTRRDQVTSESEPAGGEEARRQQIADRAERVAQFAHCRGVVLFSHDDYAPEQVDRQSRLGVSVSEFPIDVATARRAKELGLMVCMGAPNVVRGRSHGGSIPAVDAVRLGLVDLLCSDYHPPSLVQSAFRLADEKVVSLPAAVTLISSGPARAAGLRDRGEIRPGLLADLIVVGKRLGLPAVTHTIIGGSIVATG